MFFNSTVCVGRLFVLFFSAFLLLLLQCLLSFFVFLPLFLFYVVYLLHPPSSSSSSDDMCGTHTNTQRTSPTLHPAVEWFLLRLNKVGATAPLPYSSGGFACDAQPMHKHFQNNLPLENYNTPSPITFVFLLIFNLPSAICAFNISISILAFSSPLLSLLALHTSLLQLSLASSHRPLAVNLGSIRQIAFGSCSLDLQFISTVSLVHYPI